MQPKRVLIANAQSLLTGIVQVLLEAEGVFTIFDAFPTDFDALIDEVLDLPDPCIAPIVFVTSPTGAWFAVTGVEQP